MPNGNTSPYGELFELPEVGGEYRMSEGYTAGDINWENPSAEELSMIQQNPQLQMEYLQNIMKSGEYFGGEATFDFTRPGGISTEKNIYDQAQEDLSAWLTYGKTGPSWGEEQGISEFLALTPEQIEEQIARLGTSGMGMSEDEFQTYIGYFTDMQEGLKRLQGGDIGIGALERELGLLQRDVTGPGGLTQQKGSMADILQQKIGTSRQEYVPQEKVSRYGQVTGTGGGVDPTSSYLSSVGSDVSAYGKAITGVDKSIYDILYGTDPGSIHDIYGQYGEGVKKSLFDGG